SFADALVLPDDVAGPEILAGPAAFVGVAVEQAVDEDHAAMVIDHVGVGVNFRDVAAANFHRLAADTITGRHIDLAVVVDGGWDHGGFAGELGLPQHLARFGDAQDAVHEQLHVFAFPPLGDGDDGGILGVFCHIAGLPDNLAGLGVQSGDGA